MQNKTNPDDLIRRLSLLLDACLDDLDRKARLEKKQEEGKSIRNITHQQRAEAALETITEATDYLNRQKG